MPRTRPYICVTNDSTVLTDDQVRAVIPALQRQITYHWEPLWGSAASLGFEKNVAPNDWQLAVLDDSDQAGALGYHDVTSENNPLGRVFAKTDIEAGLSWTVTMSHELLEMLGDPFVNQLVQLDQHRVCAYESCDAVEADNLGYHIGDTLVSDFMTPEWFIPGSDGPYDYAGHCSKPFQLLKGGYIGIYDFRTGQWSQVSNGRPRHVHGNRFKQRERMKPIRLARLVDDREDDLL